MIKDYNNSLKTWYGLTYELIGYDWTIELGRVLNGESINNVYFLKENKWEDISLKEDIKKNIFLFDYIKFFSPSANIGLYEKKIFKHINNTNKTFLISDKVKIKKTTSKISENFGVEKVDPEQNFIMEYGYKAQKMNDLIRKFNIESFNVIFDIKGALWYTKGNKTIKLLEIMKANLEDDGIIIIDNFHNPNKINVRFKSFINRAASFIGLGKYTTLKAFSEESTLERMFHRYSEEGYKKNKVLKYAIDNFYIYKMPMNKNAKLVKSNCDFDLIILKKK